MNTLPIYNSFFKKYSLKDLSALLVYLGITLLAISDSGIQLLILMEVGPGSRTLRLTAMWLLFAKVLLTKYTKKEFFILTPIIALALYNYYVSGNIFCIYTILVIASMKDIDYSIFFKVLFYSTLSSVIFVGFLSFLEIGSPTQLTQDFGRGLVETRYCFGLYHPNIWHQAIARCIVFGSIGYYKQLNIIHLLILFLFNYFIYTLSISRTGLLATWIFLILVIFYKYLSKLMHTFLIKLLALTGIISVYALYVYFAYDFAVNWTLNSQLFDWKITTGRIQQAIEFLSYYPIKLFSSRFPDDGTLFDLGAFRIFYECGYLWSGIFFIAFFILIIITRPTYNIIVFFLPLLIFTSNRKLRQ